MGFRQLLIVFSQPVIFSAIVFSGGKRISIWVTSILLLGGYNSLKYKYFFWRVLDTGNLQDEEVFVLLYAIAWVELRCISFSLDYIDKLEQRENIKDKENLEHISTWDDLISMFSYVLYLPVLFVGPIILYEEFEKSFHVNNENLLLRLKRFIWDMMIFLMYTFLLELAFHYIYFFALQSQLKVSKVMFHSNANCGNFIQYIKLCFSYVLGCVFNAFASTLWGRTVDGLGVSYEICYILWNNSSIFQIG